MEDNEVNDDKYKIEHQKRLKMLSLQALMLMLAIILLPPLFYSTNLIIKSTTADEVIVAISIGVFASVVYLWILDATDILPFKSVWVSRSVYGAAIASILGTSAAVYQGYFVGDKHPYRGAWELTHGNYVFNTSISYSKNSETYWGYSEVIQGREEDKLWFVSLEIPDFNPDDKLIIIRKISGDYPREEKIPITIKRNGKLIESANKDMPLRMKREN